MLEAKATSGLMLIKAEFKYSIWGSTGISVPVCCGITILSRRSFYLHSEKRSRKDRAKRDPRDPVGRQAFTGRYMLENPSMVEYLTKYKC